jgi:hypothetical protein
LRQTPRIVAILVPKVDYLQTIFILLILSEFR